MQENYKILGVSESATDAEIDTAYAQLKRKYSNERFYEGEIGNEAAKNLTKLENAYAEIIASRKKTNKDNTPDFSSVEQLIKDGKYAEAQSILDDFTDRSAEWHYLQSVLFYKKNWLNESKKQLEIALEMNPGSEKYRTAYAKLKAKTDFDQTRYQSGNAQQQEVNNRQMGDSGCGAMMDCCATWCCMNMLCNGCCR
ncbi:MAG: hypothetical protein E7362_03220 [Clostridiales bacterium]|nr:hypothetical protein [Clostridiales bacterium]